MSASMSDGPHDETRRSNRRLLVKLGVVAVAMFGFGYALVPFYERICEATGLRNIDRADDVRSTQVDATRTVRIEFDSNVRKLPWTFRPLEPIIGVHPGEVRQAMFEIANTTDPPPPPQEEPLPPGPRPALTPPDPATSQSTNGAGTHPTLGRIADS